MMANLARLIVLCFSLAALPADVRLNAFVLALVANALQVAHVLDIRMMPMVSALHLLHGRLVNLGFSTYRAMRLSAATSSSTLGLGFHAQLRAMRLSALRSTPKVMILASEHCRLQYLPASPPHLRLTLLLPHQKQCTVTRRTLSLGPLRASDADHLHLSPQ